MVWVVVGGVWVRKGVWVWGMRWRGWAVSLGRGGGHMSVCAFRGGRGALRGEARGAGGGAVRGVPFLEVGEVQVG